MFGQVETTGCSKLASQAASSAPVGSAEAGSLGGVAAHGATGDSVDRTTFEEDWTQTDQAAAISMVSLLERRLFDAEEHLRPGMTQERAEQVLSQINALRYRLGWLRLDLHHNPVWPDEPGS